MLVVKVLPPLVKTATTAGRNDELSVSKECVRAAVKEPDVR